MIELIRFEHQMSAQRSVVYPTHSRLVFPFTPDAPDIAKTWRFDTTRTPKLHIYQPTVPFRYLCGDIWYSSILPSYNVDDMQGPSPLLPHPPHIDASKTYSTNVPHRPLSFRKAGISTSRTDRKYTNLPQSALPQPCHSRRSSK